MYCAVTAVGGMGEERKHQVWNTSEPIRKGGRFMLYKKGGQVCQHIPFPYFTAEEAVIFED
jgi:hypothetical protein